MDVGNLFRGAGRFIVRADSKLGNFAVSRMGKSALYSSSAPLFPNANTSAFPRKGMYWGAGIYAAYGGMERKRRGEAFFSPGGMIKDALIGGTGGRILGHFMRGAEMASLGVKIPKPDITRQRELFRRAMSRAESVHSRSTWQRMINLHRGLTTPTVYWDGSHGITYTPNTI